MISDEAGLLPAIYDGPFEEPMWSSLLDRLRQQTGADYAAITFRAPGKLGQPIHLFSGRPSSPQQVRFYRDEAEKRDPVPYFDLEEERVYALSDFIVPSDPVHRAFVRDILQPTGVDALRMVRVTEPGGISAWLNISRSGSDFTPADGTTLGEVAPHFRRSLRAYSELERHKANTRITAEVMERLNFGWISLNKKGVIVSESVEAHKMLRHGSGLRRGRSGRLTAVDPVVDRKLSAAIRSLGEIGEPQPRALNISHDPWVEILLTPAKADPNSPAQAPAMVAFIHGDNRSLADRHEQLAELFGLLPSEARFALALSRGLSIAEAAESLGVTIQTARSYSKTVYAKMGARGQTDLVRFILTSVLALA